MFDFNVTPLAPTGTKLLLHEKSGSRGSWSVRAINGWYVNRAKDRDRFYQVIPEKPRGEGYQTQWNFPPVYVRFHSYQHQKTLELR